MVNDELFFGMTNNTSVSIAGKNRFPDFLPFWSFQAAKSFVLASLDVVGALVRAIAWITPLKSAWVNYKWPVASLTQQRGILAAVALVFPSAIARTKFLPSVIGFCTKDFSTLGTSLCRKFLRGIVTRARAILCNCFGVRLYGKLLAAILARKNRSGKFSHDPLPFVALVIRWGRMARLSIFSMRLARSHLAQHDYNMGGAI